ncbi:MAG: PAS domain-containing protein [Bacteroidota bacterium]
MRKTKLTVSRSLMLFAILVGILALINFATIRYFKLKETKDAALVNVSGRNRMLSQKIGFYAEMLVSGKESARQILAKTVNLHDLSLNRLKNGGMAPELANETVLPKVDDEILPLLLEVENLWKKYREQALIIANSEEHTNYESQAALEFIETNAQAMLQKNNELVKGYVAASSDKQSYLGLLLVILLGINLIIVVGGFLMARKFIVGPIRTLAQASEKVAKGLSYEKIQAHSDPDITRITNSIELMRKNIDQSTKFSEQIANGKFDFQFDQEVQNNRLFVELSHMRKKLMEVAEEDRKRNWTTEGLALFGEILRSNQNNLKQLGDEIISSLVKYLNANQGSLFVLNDNNKDDEPSMELLACYAWERKKFLEKKIGRGQGLIGQSWMEGDVIYMTEIPDGYITITSGLGEANPTSLLIIPLMVNDEIYGILEMASFNELKNYEIDFVKKAGESIASTFSSVKTNQNTKILLEQSQQQAEEMRAQEEEIRQNMEEMQATQEEMRRKQVEIDGKMTAINAANAVIEFEADGTIITANELFLESMQYSLDEIRGKHHRLFVDTIDLNSQEYSDFWNKLASGQSFSGEFKRISKDGSYVWLSASYTPIIDAYGTVTKVIKLAQDITKDKTRSLNFENQINAINISQGVIEFDLKGYIQTANTVFLDLMGYEIQEIEGKHHSIFCQPDYVRSDAYKEFWEILSRGEFNKGEFTRVKKNGDEILLKATYSPIFDVDGRPYKVVKFANEIEIVSEDI